MHGPVCGFTGACMTKNEITTDQVPDPPAAPHVRRRIRIPLEQWIGVALLLGIVVLSAAGILQRYDATVRVAQHGLDIDVTYPTRARYREDVQIIVRIENTSQTPVDTLRVIFPAALFGTVADLQFLPEASGAREVTIADVLPGEPREIEAELRPSWYGRRTGDLVIDAGARRITITLTTLIMP